MPNSSDNSDDWIYGTTEFPLGKPFGEQLAWHMRTWGTRPNGSILKRGEKWQVKEFVIRAHLSTTTFNRVSYVDKESGKTLYRADMSAQDDADIENALRTDRAWRNRGVTPDKDNDSVIEEIKKLLFGESKEFIRWKEEFERALEQARQEEQEKQSKGGGNKKKKPPTDGTASIPAVTNYFMGRDEEKRSLVEKLLSRGSSNSVMVQGGPGIGKTELTKAIADDKKVSARFGTRRWFVPLETATSAAALQDAILIALGLDPKLDFQAALEHLRLLPSLLVLDNLETPWEPDDERHKTEFVLSALGGIPGLVTLASFRGRETVGGLPWLWHRIEPLSAPHDRKLFCAVAGLTDSDDPDLTRLLKALGGIPLAIVLVATQASDGTPLSLIWREWEKVGAEMARHPDFEGRLYSLPQSIELSVKSPRLKDGKGLFQLLGQLPAGIATEDRDALLKDESLSATHSLVRTGLGFWRGTRVDMLPPIRDHAARHHLPDDLARFKCAEHFTNLARDLADLAFQFEGADARQRIIPEIPNVEASVLYAVRHPSLLATGVETARHLRRLFTHTGLGSTATLFAIADACRNENESLSEGKVCVQIGIFAHERGELNVAWQALERGLLAFQRASNAEDVTNGKGDCLYRMADIHLYRCELSDALNLYFKAKDHYEITDYARGLADCTYRVGDIEMRRGKYADAINYAHQAEKLYDRANFHLGIAHSAWLRARSTLDSGDLDGAEKLYEVAQKRFEKAAIPLGIAHCRNENGYIALGRGNYALARSCFDDSYKMYVDVQDERGITMCYLGLAKVSRGEGDRTTALELANKALELCSRSNVLDYIARCNEELALLSVDADEAKQFAVKARDAFAKAENVPESQRIHREYLS